MSGRRDIEVSMRFKEIHGVVLTIVAVVLCAAQGWIWMNTTAHAQSETDVQQRIERHAPSEILGLAGMTLLLVAGVALSLHPKETVDEAL